MSKLIYIAGASTELDRVDWWNKQVTSIGWQLTCDWSHFVKQEGPKNDEGFIQQLQAKYARMDTEAVLQADVHWVLWPTHVSHGAAFETGVAYATNYFRYLAVLETQDMVGRAPHPYIIASGPTALKSIFTALICEDGFGARFATDEEAFQHLQERFA